MDTVWKGPVKLLSVAQTANGVDAAAQYRYFRISVEDSLNRTFLLGSFRL